MEDFITLTCPSCGGKLQVSRNTSVLNCQHCGTEHLVRRDAGGVSLESFARCPQCGRNDRAEKVSAIIRSQRQELVTSERKTEFFLDESGNRKSKAYDVPMKNTQYTALAQSLLPPTEPEKPSVDFSFEPPAKIMVGKFFLKLSAIFVLFISTISPLLITIGFIIDLEVTAVVFFGILGISSLVGGIKLLRLAKTIEKRHKDKILGSEEYKVVQKESEREYLQGKQKRELANKRWESLYYCNRDDCVFIPNEGTYAPVERMREYIYQD